MNYENYELIAPGHRACAGCLEPAIVRWVLKIAGPNTIAVSATGCLEVVTSLYPETAWRIPWIHVAFENAAAVASGIEAALKALKRKDDTNIIVFAGDGGTIDIGFQALSGMVERGHDVMYVMLDNEAYMNTGVQRSSSTPRGAWTTTTPTGTKSLGKLGEKKPISRIIAAHNSPYVATASISYIDDFKAKIEKALTTKGPTFIEAFSACPTGWGLDPSKSIEITRLAVETGIFILWEVENGDLKNIHVTYKPIPRKPVIEYLKAQRRFRHLISNQKFIDSIQYSIDKKWAELSN